MTQEKTIIPEDNSNNNIQIIATEAQKLAADAMYDAADDIAAAPNEENSPQPLEITLLSYIEQDKLKHTLSDPDLHIANSIVGNSIRIAFNANDDTSPYRRHSDLDALTSCLNKAACKTGDIIEFDGLSQMIQIYLKQDSWLGDFIHEVIELRNAELGTSPLLS